MSKMPFDSKVGMGIITGYEEKISKKDTKIQKAK